MQMYRKWIRNSLNLRNHRRKALQWLRLNKLKRTRYLLTAKRETLIHYGKRHELLCRWRNCKVSDLVLLSLDHIKNDGALERGKNKAGGQGFYIRLRTRGYPKGYQTLCFNHQAKKEFQRRKKLARRMAAKLQ